MARTPLVDNLGRMLVNASERPLVGPELAGSFRSGVSFNVDDDGIRDRMDFFDDWRGKPATACTIFTGGDSTGQTWAGYAARNTFSNNTNSPLFGATGLLQRGCMANICMGLVCKGDPGPSGPQKFRDVDDGDFDVSIDLVCTKLKNLGYSASNANMLVFRLGHEMNLRRVFPWGADFDAANNYVNYKNAFRHVSDRIRLGTNMPWAQISFPCFKFSVTQAGAEYEIEDIYPGDDFVTHITVDWYDASPVSTSGNFASGVWRNDPRSGSVNEPRSLKQWADYAKSHQKLFGVDEWGLRAKEDPGAPGGADNPNFIQNMYNEFVAIGSPTMDFETYFRIDRAHPFSPSGGPVPGDDEVNACVPGQSVHSLYSYLGGASLANIRSITPFVGLAPAGGGAMGGGRYCGFFNRCPTGTATPAAPTLGINPNATGLATTRYRQLFGTLP